MIKCATDAGKRTELITNASLLTAEMSERLLQSGLNMLWVSMDGFSKESYEAIRKGSMYSLITDNLTEFNRRRFSQTYCQLVTDTTGIFAIDSAGENSADFTIKATTAKLGITFVIMKENEYELAHINQFADDFAVDIINLSYVIPGEPLPASEALYEKTFPVGKMYRFRDTPAPKQYDHCTFVNDGSCFIRWNGEVCPCMQLLHNSYTYLWELRRKVYAKSFGNINRMPFDSIWNHPDYVRFRDYVTRFDYPSCTLCLGCDLRLENIEDCMHNVHPTCGACLWAQGFARCP